MHNRITALLPVDQHRASLPRSQHPALPGNTLPGSWLGEMGYDAGDGEVE